MRYFINRPLRAGLLALLFVELAMAGDLPPLNYALAGVWAAIALVEAFALADGSQ